MPPIDTQPLQPNISRPEVASGSPKVEGLPSSPEAQTAPVQELARTQPGAPASQLAPTTPAPQSQSVLVQQAATTATPSLSTTPGDSLDKVWIDRANDIIDKNASNPRAEEELQEDLSAAYLKQRFNLEIKRSNLTQK